MAMNILITEDKTGFGSGRIVVVGLMSAMVLSGCVATDYANSKSDAEAVATVINKSQQNSSTENQARLAELELITAVQRQNCYSNRTVSLTALKSVDVRTVRLPTVKRDYGTGGGEGGEGGGGC